MSDTNTDKNQLVIGYWAIRGLVEPIRLALHYTKTPYTEKLYVQGEGPEYSQEEWLSEKQKLGLGKSKSIVIFFDIFIIIFQNFLIYHICSVVI